MLPAALVAILTVNLWTFLRFWQDKEKTDAATADSNAKFVEVLVNARSVDYALLPVTGLITSDAIQGIALAGLGSSICKMPPVMMCNPRESADPGFDVEAYIGKGIRLLANEIRRRAARVVPQGPLSQAPAPGTGGRRALISLTPRLVTGVRRP